MSARAKAARTPDPLSRVALVAALLDHGHGSVAEYLPLADAALPALLAADGPTGAPLDESSIERAVARLAAQHCTRYTADAKRYDTWAQTATSDVTDPIDTLTIENTQAAFALGLALGLRLGGAR
ncbi:MAG: hypothetical protein AB7H93_16560 [Vicinamibacterales bacterium]